MFSNSEHEFPQQSVKFRFNSVKEFEVPTHKCFVLCPLSGSISLTVALSVLFCRLLSTTNARLNADDGWISKLLVRKIEPTKESHSRMLSDKEIVYALHTHNIRPDCMEKYLKN